MFFFVVVKLGESFHMSATQQKCQNSRQRMNSCFLFRNADYLISFLFSLISEMNRAGQFSSAAQSKEKTKTVHCTYSSDSPWSGGGGPCWMTWGRCRSRSTASSCCRASRGWALWERRTALVPGTPCSPCGVSTGSCRTWPCLRHWAFLPAKLTLATIKCTIFGFFLFGLVSEQFFFHRFFRPGPQNLQLYVSWDSNAFSVSSRIENVVWTSICLLFQFRNCWKFHL